MTKQEQIEDMAKAACAVCGRGGYHCPILPKYRPCDASLKYAEAVYNAGYRKAEGVRKETAKEILDMLYDMGIDKGMLECCRISDVNGVSLAKQICEKYDVEVEQ